MSTKLDTQTATTPGERSIEKIIEIDAPIGAVWKALTDAEELTRWFPLDAKVKPGAGGSMWMSWRNEYKFDMPIEIWEENKHLRLIWAAPSSEKKDDASKAELDASTFKSDIHIPHKLAVDYFLEAKGGRTILRLVHFGFSTEATWDGQYDGTRRGWDIETRSLRHYLEKHRGTPREVVYIRKRLQCKLDEAWSRFMGRAGIGADAKLNHAKEGDRYSLTSSTDDRWSGKVHLVRPPKDFVVTIDELNNAYVYVMFDDGNLHQPLPEMTMWISLYGVDPAKVTALRGRMEKLMDGLTAK